MVRLTHPCITYHTELQPGSSAGWVWKVGAEEEEQPETFTDFIILTSRLTKGWQGPDCLTFNLSLSLTYTGLVTAASTAARVGAVRRLAVKFPPVFLQVSVTGTRLVPQGQTGTYLILVIKVRLLKVFRDLQQLLDVHCCYLLNIQ